VLNNYYSVPITAVAQGTTKVAFAAGNAATHVVLVNGHAAAAPTVRSLSTHAGPTRGGNAVTISGSGFSHVTSVVFGSVRATKVKVASSGNLTAQAPAGASAHYVTVTTASGGPNALTGRSLYNYLPAPLLTSIHPSSGPPGGGTRVTITGANLAYVRSVDFGPNRGSHLVVISSHELTIVSPAGTGTRDIFVRTAGGVTRRHPADRFTY